MVDLTVFADWNILGASLIVTLVAIIGKLVTGWSFTSSKKINRAIIGAGMIPRGEVGLIFAIVGKNIGVINDDLYAITVAMVVLTTFVAPPLIAYFVKREDGGTPLITEITKA